MKIFKSAKTWLVAGTLGLSIIACQSPQPQVVIDPNAQPQQYAPQQAPTMYSQPAPNGMSDNDLFWLYVLTQQRGSMFYGGGYMPHSYYYMQPSQRVYVYHQHYYNPGYGNYYNSRSYNRNYTYVPPRSNTYQSNVAPSNNYRAYGTYPSSPSVTTRNSSSAFSSGNNYRYGWGNSSSPSTTKSYSGSSSFRGGSSSYGSSSYHSYGGSSSYHSSSGFSSRSSSFGRH